MQVRTRHLALLTLILLLCSTAAGALQAGSVFLVEFKVDRDRAVRNVSMDVMEAETSFPEVENGNYTVRLMNDENTELYSGRTDFRFFEVSMWRIVEKDRAAFMARIPYYTDATRLEVGYNGTSIRNVSIPGQICSTASDDVCLSHCRDRGIDPDCEAAEPDDTVQTGDTAQKSETGDEDGSDQEKVETGTGTDTASDKSSGEDRTGGPSTLLIIAAVVMAGLLVAALYIYRRQPV